MEKYVIRGGKPLVGDVNIGGAKNAAVAILPATILAGGKCLIENLPCISDVMASLQILSELGASIRMVSRSTYEIDTSHLDSTEVSNELSRQMRASYYFLGALLGRFGSGQVAMPGGCNLGPRPIDQHLKAFTAFGAEDSVEYGQIHVRSEHLVGGHVFFDTVSVGATMNAMLAAVLAEGTTILENVAREPHIVDLANFLNMMGADVHGAGTDVIKIHGVKEMHGCNYFGKTTTRSAPFAIFDRQDVLRLALDLDVPIPAEYGEIAKDRDGKLYTTKAQRTGCTMCGFGIHIEGRPHRFDVLRETNPKEWEFWMKHVCRDENGNWYGWGRVLDYIGIGWEDVPEQAVQMHIDDLIGWNL